MCTPAIIYLHILPLFSISLEAFNLQNLLDENPAAKSAPVPLPKFVSGASALANRSAPANPKAVPKPKVGSDLVGS